MNIIARRPNGLSLYGLSAVNQEAAVTSVPGTSYHAAPDGSKLLSATAEGVDVYDSAGSNKVLSVPEPNVLLMALSPAGGYLVTAQRPGKDEGGQPGKNIKVWDLSSGRLVLGLTQKSVSKDTWPVVQWAGDDSCLAHTVTNTVHVYSRADGFASYRKVTIKGIGAMAISPGTAPRLAAFMPEAKAGPASAGIYDYSQAEPQPLLKKSFFRCNGARLMWNKPGSSLLALSYADYDVTNQSYYGEQKLHYLPADPARSDQACTVALAKEGPVHDVQWSPSGSHFVVVAGFMPAKITLYDANCKAVYELGSGPYNMVRWSPFDRFLMVAGFGNLPGDIIFYDKKASGSLKQMGAVRCPAVSAEWGPDGRHLLVATTAPRLRVDNSYKVFTYYGKQVAAVQFDVLYDAAWMPAAPGTYQDRPQSPERLDASAKGAPASPGPASGPQQAPKAASYVPPALRAAGAAAASSGAKFSLAYDEDDRVGKITAARAAAAAARVPPGAEFVAKPSSKNAKKRSGKKKEGGAEEGEEQQACSSSSGPARQLAAATEALTVQDNAGDSEEARQKKIRNLQKKLRQIQDLKEKRDKEGPQSLQPEQLAKLQGEEALVAELKALGA